MKFFVATVVLALAAPLASAFTVTSTTDSQVPVSDTVDYVCFFQNEWSGVNHPNLYPGSAHWSPPMLVSHGQGYTLWEDGGTATPGIEDVAETGSTSSLQGELNSASDVGSVVRGVTTFNSNTQTQTFDPLSMGPNNRYFSTITMVAPSPDWFSGFYNFDAVNEASGTWYREFVIDTFPWDAGTEEGNSYSGSNPATVPQQSIFQLTTDTVPSTGVFLNGAGTEILPLIEWTCTLQQPDPPPAPVADEEVEVADTVPFAVTTTDSEVPASDTVDYVCAFQNGWSGVNHPNLYPGDAHWSPPMLVAHSLDYSMWADGATATPGVEDVAETGSTGALEGELEGASGVGSVVRGEPTFNSETQTQTFDALSMSPSSKYFTTITMVAPSPDWFSGFYNFNAVNEVTGTWYREFVIDTFPWDAGTEDGDEYDGNNDATSPQQTIFQLTPGTIPSTGVFLNQAGNEVLPLIEWTCTLQQPDPTEAPVTTTIAATEATTTTTPEATTEAAPEATPEATTEATTAAIPEPVLLVDPIPDPVLFVEPPVTTEAAPEATPEATTEAATTTTSAIPEPVLLVDPIPDPVLFVEPPVTTEAAPEVTPEATTEAATTAAIPEPVLLNDSPIPDPMLFVEPPVTTEAAPEATPEATTEAATTTTAAIPEPVLLVDPIPDPVLFVEPPVTTEAAPEATPEATTEAATTAAIPEPVLLNDSPIPDPVLFVEPPEVLPTSCDELSCPAGTTCAIRSSVAQCFPDGPYVDPQWWDRIAAEFEGNSLKNCSRRRGVAPITGSMCAPRPKTCYFGNQECATVGPHPEMECVCIPPPDGRWGMWQCSPAVCPATV